MSKNDLSNLEKMRHSCSHVLAQAVLKLFPDAKLGIGPAIDNGFYYDFDLPRTLTLEDLTRIEEEMNRIIKENQKFERITKSIKDAILFLKKSEQSYKVDLAEELKKEGEKEVSFYINKNAAGKETFIDLCAGPHLESTGQIKAFKLTHVAGAYWRGDEKNKMLQRIYGLCFESSADLDAYLKQMEEAQKRDHRKLGKELEIFMISPEVGSGLPLWLPKGAIIRDILTNFLKEEQTKRGYLPVVTPHIGKLDLYKTSGHYDNYREHMYSAIKVDEEEFILKAMNCPHHVMIYKSKPHSYKDLPIRFAEFGTVYRYEASGELSGLTRVRGFTQDDAHLFVRPDQLKSEFLNVLDLVMFIFKKLEFKNFRVRIGLRDKKSDKYIGSDENWERAEHEIEEAVKETGLKYTKDEGDAAFYGPKLDFVVKDVIGREWQLGTIQVDYNLPERFKLEYIDEHGASVRPVMIHRAPFGSLERFIGILIEHYAGAFPFWLAPVQVKILPVSEKFANYALKTADELKSAGMRVETDLSAETLGKKIRNAELEKVPYMAVVGEKEASSGTINARDYKTKTQEVVKIKEFISRLL